VDTVRLARGGLEPVKRVGEAVDLGYHEEFEEVAVLGGEGRGGGGGGGGSWGGVGGTGREGKGGEGVRAGWGNSSDRKRGEEGVAT